MTYTHNTQHTTHDFTNSPRRDSFTDVIHRLSTASHHTRRLARSSQPPLRDWCSIDVAPCRITSVASPREGRRANPPTRQVPVEARRIRCQGSRTPCSAIAASTRASSNCAQWVIKVRLCRSVGRNRSVRVCVYETMRLTRDGAAHRRTSVRRARDE